MRWPAWRLSQGSYAKQRAADKDLMAPDIMALNFDDFGILCANRVLKSARLHVQVKEGTCAGQPGDSVKAAA